MRRVIGLKACLMTPPTMVVSPSKLLACSEGSGDLLTLAL